MRRDLRRCGCGAVVRPGPCPSCGAVVSDRARLSPAGALLGLVVLAGCPAEVNDLYGAPVTDSDGDGYVLPEDCDDGDPAVYPGAAETAGDGVDSDCDGQDDPVE